MRRGLVWLLGLTPTLALGGTSAPMVWSPDGRWVAYTVATRAERPIPAPGWLFDTNRAGGSLDVVREATVAPGVFRIYAVNGEDGSSVLLEESTGPLTSPAWGPDGRALAFGRLVRQGPGQACFEVVIQDAPGRDRVIVSQPLKESLSPEVDWTALLPAWSPDGHYLVVPDLKAPPGLRIVETESGRVLKTIQGGTAPAWSPDGTTLAFVRTDSSSSLLAMEIGPGRADRASSVHGMGLTFGPPRHLAELGQTYQTPVWSRDGKSVMAIARRFVSQTSGPILQVELLRVRVESGAVDSISHLVTEPNTQNGFDLRLMSWGDGTGVPSSGKSLVVVGTDSNGVLHIRIFDAIGHRIGDKDETQLRNQTLAIKSLKQKLPSLLPPHILTDAEKKRVIVTATTIVGDTRSLHGVCLGHDRDFEELFYSLDLEPEPAIIVWYRPSHQETHDRFNPLNFLVRISSLSFSPDGKTLAIRFGERDNETTAALYDVRSRHLWLLTPDDDSRLEWASLLIETARKVAKAGLPSASVAGRPVERPTILPVPGEVPPNQEFLLQLQRLGRLGRPLCEASRTDDRDPARSRFLYEARLFFDVLREDHPAALSSLEALEARTTVAEHRERLLAVRGQVFLGMGDVDRAADTIGFLRSLEESCASRIEITPAGTTMTPEPITTKGWSGYLRNRLDDLAKSPPGHNEHDANAFDQASINAFLRGQMQNRAFEAGRELVPGNPAHGPRPAPVGEPVPDVRARFPRPRPVPPPPAVRPPLSGRET